MKGQVVLVTGGSSGIGKSIVLLFAKGGARVIFSYKDNLDGAKGVIGVATKVKGEIYFEQADLCKQADGLRLVESVVKRFGRIDILVNNAGRYLDGDEWDADMAIWVDSLKQNFLGAVNVSKNAIEIMKRQKSGVIVNIASRYSVSGQYDALTYSAAKAAIVNMTQAQAKLMAPWGRANAISPGVVRTGYWLTAPKEELDRNFAKIPMGRLVEPEEVAQLVVFLASDKARMITGQNIIIDGGYTQSS